MAAQYTEDQVIAYIAERIIYNTAGQITDTVMRNVLNYANSRIYEPSEIPVSVAGIEATNLETALLELLGSEVLTIGEIVTGIEALTLTDRLSYNALKDIPDPVSYADFIAIFEGTHYESDNPIIVEEGDTVLFESRLSIAEAFSTITWAAIDSETAASQIVIARDAEFTFPNKGFFAILLSVKNLEGSTIISKTIGNFVNVQDVSLFYVEFLATDYNSDPLVGVAVTFAGAPTKVTNNEGKITFVNIEAGAYSLLAALDGFDSVVNGAFAVSANMDASSLPMVLNAYIENESLLGTNEIGDTVTALYDFMPAGYEGATQIKWWVEDDGGTIIVAADTKIKGTDVDYNEFVIPEAAAGYILKAEIKAYDVELNTNANMLKTPFMMVAAPSLPVYFGYLTAAQNTGLSVIPEAIALGTTYPTQQDEINQSSNHDNFPETIDVKWKDIFAAMQFDEYYTAWVAISEADLATEYDYYQDINNTNLIGKYDTKGVVEDLSIDGNDYKVYKLNSDAPRNYRLSTTGL